LSIAVFTADGTYHEVDPDGTSGLGAWRATGETTMDLTILYPGEDGTTHIRATVEMAADGQSFIASYTFELVGIDGISTGEYGPGEAAGTRLAIEAPGTPVGSMADLFAQFGGTPEATPAP
jgi:hypothetical protein